VKENKSPFNQVLLLTGARIFGVLFSIVIPMYLGRKLSVETYGTYKQIMLFFWFAQVALNLGLDDSAYFFLRWEPKKFPLYSANALVFNLLATGLLWALMTIFSHQIASLLNNASLEIYLPLLGYLTLATVSSMQIEGILIGMNRMNERLVIEMGMEILKSMAIIGAFYFFNSLKVVLVLLSLLMTIRLLITVATILSYKKKEGLKFSDAPSLMMSQLKFGLPLGLSRILQNILNIENFFISSFFSLAQFTYYTVGCFENPLVNATRTSMYEIINIEMIDALKHEGTSRAIRIWKEMSRKLFLIIIPLVIFMIFFGKEIIVFIFSEKYLPSVSFFMVFNLYLIVGALNPEPLFRANSKTHVALKIKIIGLSIGVLLFVLGAWLGGPIWALIGKIAGVLFMNIIGLNQGAKLLESKFTDLFAWNDLAISSLISIGVAGLLKFAFQFVAWKPFWILALSFSLFTVFYFFFSYLSKIIKDEELYLIKKTLFQKILRVNAL
jgi:O-antigen/teichoic acid export membrane protein